MYVCIIVMYVHILAEGKWYFLITSYVAISHADAETMMENIV